MSTHELLKCDLANVRLFYAYVGVLSMLNQSGDSLMTEKQSNKPAPAEKQDLGESQTGRGVHFLPQIFTTAGLFSGFYAVVAAMTNNFGQAAAAIFVSMLMDSLDGRVARLTNTQSNFGAQYDSLSDMVAFGMAPALVMYSWVLHDLGKPGWLVAFFFTATAALRLARFNSRIGKDSKAFFLGLPSPAAAGVLAGLVAVGVQYKWDDAMVLWLAAPLTVLMAVLMISNVSYYSFKEVAIQKRVPYFWGLVSIALLILITINPPVVLFGGFGIYALSGLLLAGRRRLRRKQPH